VPGEGNLNTVIMFVGEGPGFEEDKQSRPFVGRSGQFLTNAMQKVGIDRSQVYITNVVKCRPPDNRDPLPGELTACNEYLDGQVALINPRIIVTLGRFSMRKWFPEGSITRLHGQVKNIGHGRIAVAMFHPAAALRNPQWAVEFEKDFQILPRLIERAKRANEAAARGEGLPAGVPHPGDVGYVAPAAPPVKPLQELAVELPVVEPPAGELAAIPLPLAFSSVEEPSGPPRPPVTPASPDDTDDGSFAQLSLF
jgi:DNA polymerase